MKQICTLVEVWVNAIDALRIRCVNCNKFYTPHEHFMNRYNPRWPICGTEVPDNFPKPDANKLENWT